MNEPIVLDVRESYRRPRELASIAIHVPLGVLLGDPERTPRDRPILVMGVDTRESEFAARFLRGHGRQAFALRGDDADF